MKDRVFFTDKVEERKSFDVCFYDTASENKPAEYYIKVVETPGSWDSYLCHVECPYPLFVSRNSKEYTAGQVLDGIQGFINEYGDMYIDMYERKFLGK